MRRVSRGPRRFFAIWGGLAYLLNKWSREQDEQPAQLIGPQDRRFRLLSAPGLVIFVLSITLMSVDWVMSVDPHWYSTIFGVLMIGGQGLATMAFTLVVLAALVKHEPMSRAKQRELPACDFLPVNNVPLQPADFLRQGYLKP